MTMMLDQLPPSSGRPEPRRPDPGRTGERLDYAIPGMEKPCWPDRAYAVGGGVGILPVDGMLWWGWSTQLVIAAMDAMAADPAVRVPAIDMHCHGGSAYGMNDLERAADRLRQAKGQLHGLAHDLAASSGYWLLSRCSRVYGTPTSIVGSIGTVQYAMDDSGYYEKEGFVARHLATHPNKAYGMPGVRLTPEMLAEQKTLLEAHAADFFAAIAERRNMTAAAVRGLEARVFYGAGSVAAGLVDEIMPWDRFLDTLRQLAGGTPGRLTPARVTATPSTAPTITEPHDGAANLESSMSTPATAPANPPTPPTPPAANGGDVIAQLTVPATPPPVTNAAANAGTGTGTPPAAKIPPPPATPAELADAFPGEEAFCFRCLQRGLDLNAALRDHNVVLRERVNALQAQKPPAAPPARAPTPSVPTTVPPVGASAGAQTPTDFEAAIDAIVETEKMPRKNAIREAVRRHPDLHKAYVAANQ